MSYKLKKDDINLSMFFVNILVQTGCQTIFSPELSGVFLIEPFTVDRFAFLKLIDMTPA